jgi:aquaporin Z
MEDWARPLIVEFIGTFTLIFAGAGAIIMTQGENLVAIALAHGLAIGLMIAAAGHISGGVFNPAVAIGLLIGKRLGMTKTAAYIVIELLGAAVAALFLTLIFPEDAVNNVELGTPVLGGDIGASAGLFMEIILSFFLMFVIFGSAVDTRGARAIAPLAIGLIITMDIFVGGAVTGAAMNPARAFGPALVQNLWTDQWIWWVGPIVGAAVAAGVFQYLLIPPREQR